MGEVILTNLIYSCCYNENPTINNDVNVSWYNFYLLYKIFSILMTSVKCIYPPVNVFWVPLIAHWRRYEGMLYISQYLISSKPLIKWIVELIWSKVRWSRFHTSFLYAGTHNVLGKRKWPEIKSPSHWIHVGKLKINYYLIAKVGN